MHEIKWKGPAIADLLQIIDYISDDNPSAAQTLKDDIEIKVAGLARNPRQYKAGRVAGTREMVIRPTTLLSIERQRSWFPFSGFCTLLGDGPKRSYDT